MLRSGEFRKHAPFTNSRLQISLGLEFWFATETDSVLLGLKEFRELSGRVQNPAWKQQEPQNCRGPEEQ